MPLTIEINLAEFSACMRWALPDATRNESEEIRVLSSERSWRYFGPAARRRARSGFGHGRYDRSPTLCSKEQANGESLVKEESVDEYVVEQRKRGCWARAKHRFGGD
jgi:hypothetical protein